MKKIIIAIGLATVALAGVFTYFILNREIVEVESMIIVVPKSQHHIMNRYERLKVPMFFTKLSDAEIINDADSWLKSGRNSIKNSYPELIESHIEYHNGMTFYGYEYSFTMNFIEGEIDYKDSYLEFRLADRLFTIFIGDVYLVHDQTTHKFNMMTSIEGRKIGHHLSEVIMTFETEEPIREIYLGQHLAEFSQIGLDVVVKPKVDYKYYFNDPFIKVVGDNDQFYIYYMEFFDSYDLLTNPHATVYSL